MLGQARKLTRSSVLTYVGESDAMNANIEQALRARGLGDLVNQIILLLTNLDAPTIEAVLKVAAEHRRAALPDMEAQAVERLIDEDAILILEGLNQRLDEINRHDQVQIIMAEASLAAKAAALEERLSVLSDQIDAVREFNSANPSLTNSAEVYRDLTTAKQLVDGLRKGRAADV